MPCPSRRKWLCRSRRKVLYNPQEHRSCLWYVFCLFYVIPATSCTSQPLCEQWGKLCFPQGFFGGFEMLTWYVTQTWNKIFLNIAFFALLSHFSALSLLSILVLCGFPTAVFEYGLFLYHQWGALTQNMGCASSRVDLSIDGPWAEVLIHLFLCLWVLAGSHLPRFNANKKAMFWQSFLASSSS